MLIQEKKPSVKGWGGSSVIISKYGNTTRVEHSFLCEGNGKQLQLCVLSVTLCVVSMTDFQRSWEGFVPGDLQISVLAPQLFFGHLSCCLSLSLSVRFSSRGFS